jgi:cullin 3
MSKPPVFSIQKFRNQSKIGAQEAVALWQQLQTAIGTIYDQNVSILSYEELYRNAYNLVLHKHGDYLYSNIMQTIRDYLQISKIGIIEAKDEHILNVTVHAWSFHILAFAMIKDILMYMDRSYCIPRKKPLVYTMALQQFREVLLYEPTVRERLKTVLLQEIMFERQGRVIDRAVVKSILAMLVDLGLDGVNVYEMEFERSFLEETRSFFRVESLAFLSENTCHDYIVKASARLTEEAERVRHYLSLSTDPKLRAAAEHELISVHAKALLEMENTGFACMLRDNKLVELQKFYALFARVPSCLEQLREAVYRFVKQAGLDILATQEASKDPVSFVRAILELKSKFDHIIGFSFRAEKHVFKKLNEAFESFLNSTHHCASYLASYVDELLRGGIQGATEAEVEDKLEKVIVLFKFLADKDIFESFYKNLLCKRLLGGKSISDEVEKQMIAKFKAECGYQFTTKLEGMFLDMNISKSVQEDYRGSAAYQSLPGAMQMEVHVLTTGYWPLQPLAPCKLPPALLQATAAFTAFYLGINSGRKLTWLNHLGSVDLKVRVTSVSLTALMMLCDFL